MITSMTVMAKAATMLSCTRLAMGSLCGPLVGCAARPALASRWSYQCPSGGAGTTGVLTTRLMRVAIVISVSGLAGVAAPVGRRRGCPAPRSVIHSHGQCRDCWKQATSYWALLL